MLRTVSVCMIVRDEELVLERCLKNVVRFADELIVVDTGSVDSTQRIAARYTDKLYSYPWQYDFSKARNYSYQFATMDYIMWLDADDDISEEDIRNIKMLKETMPEDTDVVFMSYGGDSSDEDIFSDAFLVRDRMIRRALHPTWVYPIHEVITLNPSWNSYMRSDIKIIHRKVKENSPRRNLSIFEKKMEEGFVLNDFNRGYYCRELSTEKMDEEAVAQFQIIWEHGMKDDIDYPLSCYITSMQRLKKYRELYELLLQYIQKFGDTNIVCTILGDLCRRKEEWETSIDWYEKAMRCEVCPEDGGIHFPAYTEFLPRIGMCKAYIKLEDYYQAKKELEYAEKIHPKFLQVKLLSLFFQSRKPKTISVCMIVRDEEEVLSRCLEDASGFADEIVIVDTGSKDNTKKIASKYTDKIIDFEWCDDFAAARNVSFQNATSDYLMWLDADDRISKENIAKINQCKENLSTKLILAGYERPENGGVYLYSRMVRRDVGFVWKGIVHERMVLPDGGVLDEKEEKLADFIITHQKLTAPNYARNIKIMELYTEEELKSAFWLSAQCFLDCVMAGEEEKAAYYLKMAEESKTPFLERMGIYALSNRVLKFHKKWDAMLKWNRMYLMEREKEELKDL